MGLFKLKTSSWSQYSNFYVIVFLGFSISNNSKQNIVTHNNTKKRKRIIERMLDGLGPRKKRKFPISKVKESLQCFSGDFIEDQLRLLETHVMVDKPKRRTVQFVENSSLDAIGYLQGNCDLTVMSSWVFRRGSRIWEITDVI